LFRYSENAVLKFSYWVSEDTSRMYLQLWNYDREQNYNVYFYNRNLERGRWGHAVVRLKDLKGTLRRIPMVEGDRIRAITLGAGNTATDSFYVDKLVLEEVGEDIMPARTTAAAEGWLKASE
jgi:hypothetical protein